MTLRTFSLAAIFLCGRIPLLLAVDAAAAKFHAVEIDSKIEIGYGVTVADVDGDRKPDILLADKKQFVWYRNPSWEKFVLAENLTKLDNVCITAADIDGDGKAEVAVGAGWNPSDTTNSGAVFYLIPPADRTQKWEAVELPHEPTTHRMRWMRRADGKFDLVVVPLHGRGNKNGEGAGVKILAYKMPANPRDPWQTEVINDSMHMTHNFELLRSNPGLVTVAGKEGVLRFYYRDGRWDSGGMEVLTNTFPDFRGAGEVREVQEGTGPKFLATIEPMHGNQVVVYTGDLPNWTRRTVIDSSFKEGHALACGDLLGLGSDQIVAGWRIKNDAGKVGIKIYVPTDTENKQWKETLLDDNTMACEDLCLADLNDDGKLDVVAAGRATKNVKIYFNERGK